MKLKVVFTFLLFLFVLHSNNVVLALGINNNNILITTMMHQKLTNLGFTSQEILNMTLSEFNENKNLQGKIISKESFYFDEENYISIEGLKIGYMETTAKKMTTTIISIGDKYRYKVSVEWKIIPSNRSYDIIGIGIDNNAKIISGLNFKQNFCYSKNKCSSSIVNVPKITDTGASVYFKLPTQPIISLSTYLYFDVSVNDSNSVQLNAYGDYAHSITTIDNVNNINYSINRGGLLLDDIILNCYDSMAVSKAIWINYS